MPGRIRPKDGALSQRLSPGPLLGRQSCVRGWPAQAGRM